MLNPNLHRAYDVTAKRLDEYVVIRLTLSSTFFPTLTKVVYYRKTLPYKPAFKH